MSVGVVIPKKPQQQDEMGSLGSLVGMGAGALFGGPAGAAVGGQLGGMVGGMAADKPKDQVQAVAGVNDDAMARRKQELSQSPQMQIANSIDSLKYIEDPAQRAELAKPLLQADYMARKGHV